MINIADLLGTEAEYLLEHHCETIPAEMLHLPGPDFVDRVIAETGSACFVRGMLYKGVFL